MPCSNGRSWRNACVLNAAFDISTLVCTRGLRYSNTRSVAPRILNWCSLLHTASCNVIKRQASALGGVRMASPVDLTVSDDDEGPHQPRHARATHQHVQDAFPQHHNACEPVVSVKSAADSARAAIMGQALQANKQGANPLLAELAATRRAREAERDSSGSPAAPEQAASAPRAAPAENKRKQEDQIVADVITILSYNIWFADLGMEYRMEAIGEIIMKKGYPTILCLQEVTPESFEMMRKSLWFGRYMASPLSQQSYDTAILYNKSHVTSAGPFQKHPFQNSRMGRSVLEVALSVGGTSLRCATLHLESPDSRAPATAARQEQLAQAVEALDAVPEDNIVLAGDMNWTDVKDGRPKLSPGWRDAWPELHPGHPGYTYDGPGNPMLCHAFKNRLDRIFVKLADWEPESIEIVGQEAIPGLVHTKIIRGKEKQLPMLPSDHYGLLLRLRSGGRARNTDKQ